LQHTLPDCAPKAMDRSLQNVGYSTDVRQHKRSSLRLSCEELSLPHAAETDVGVYGAPSATGKTKERLSTRRDACELEVAMLCHLKLGGLFDVID
jgi:hypothetical protein